MSVFVLSVAAAVVLAAPSADLTKNEAVHRPATADETIDRIVSHANGDPDWAEGTSEAIHLPGSATPGEVAAYLVAKDVSYRMTETRRVHIRGHLPDSYTAVVIGSIRGRFVVFVQRVGGFWWAKAYPIAS